MDKNRIPQNENELYQGNLLRCTLTLDPISDSTNSGKKETCRNGELILGRNEYTEPILMANIGRVCISCTMDDFQGLYFMPVQMHGQPLRDTVGYSPVVVVCELMNIGRPFSVGSLIQVA